MTLSFKNTTLNDYFNKALVVNKGSNKYESKIRGEMHV